jgi:mannonate dehydratase
MRPGFGQFNVATPEYLQFAAQYGATDVLLNTPLLPGGQRWELYDLVKLRLSVEQWGLKLTALENVPTRFYDHIMLGGPRRDEQIENMICTIRNIARAGIPIFGYNWMPSHVWRTPPKVIRGGAIATAYDHGIASGLPLTHDREYSEEEMWANLEHWIRIITPVAEEEGIRLGIHPCDPPVDVLGGVPQLLRSFDAYKRLIEIYPSDANAIEFCQGTFSEMNDGSDIYEKIRYFGSRRKILYVHFRNVSGTVPVFHEEFVNTGYVDMYRAMQIYHEVGFDGFFIDDHVPQTLHDTAWGHRGRAFANGYIQGLIQAVKAQARD